MPGLKRGYENPSYLGNFEIVKRDAGLLVINELPLETYLCSVVPSEMPAAYPLESLKVQAVCARSYAIKQMHNGRGANLMYMLTIVSPIRSITIRRGMNVPARP